LGFQSYSQWLPQRSTSSEESLGFEAAWPLNKLVSQAKVAVIYCFNYYTHALLHDHLMGDIGVCFACRQDPSLFLVTARDEHTGTQMCYALLTPSKKRDHGETSVSIYLCKCNAIIILLSLGFYGTVNIKGSDIK